MNIKYCVSSTNNPLYAGNFFTNQRYKTFGQQSFILDFIASTKRQGHTVDLLIEGVSSFSLHEYVSEFCRTYEFDTMVHTLSSADLVILDKLSQEAVDMIDTKTTVIHFIHNAGESLYEPLIRLSRRIVCMTEVAYIFQAKYIDKSKLLLSHQGVDLHRFKSVGKKSSHSWSDDKIKVLLYTRLISQKKKTIHSVLDELLHCADRYRITLLGDGDYFWELNNQYGNRITVINHIPSNSIQSFITQFDVIVSSARGLMESCASGIPAICAGFGYAGLLNEETIPHLLKRNLTGYGEALDISTIHQEIATALTSEPAYWRNLAAMHFDMDTFLDRIVEDVSMLSSFEDEPVPVSLQSSHAWPRF